ncbi:uncharacterized protein LACBIDRAFT_299067 [Laccaria bicolor S238N-H82]|uniref:Predicted protein n=1 Tax=Laccaria bicolor (strain S238N-H82 / ATCC MYA-4686) TaxID=486041 RepID=B0DDY4_LACBS|nr:uncharacterized protein LACBIDRAFT_299067 [Laccaria bicolor S238N-H82]EDR07166.1 predicted protein [Laccaria bicolor S238N-H82]|eukprot:XP_001882097.1 predicted protein [Laccaria bicolor S238N-H82]
MRAGQFNLCKNKQRASSCPGQTLHRYNLACHQIQLSAHTPPSQAFRSTRGFTGE